jgi:hypothetical protein
MLVVVDIIIIIIIINNNNKNSSSTTMQPALRQPHRLFEIELSKECDLVLSITRHSIFAFP